MSKITLVNNGRTSFAMGFMNETLHLAWGSGNPDWDDVGVFPDGAPTPTVEETALTAELGRRTVTQASYVEPDSNGDIEFPESRYTISATPTRRIYLRIAFLQTEEPAATIREVGLFMGTETTEAGNYLEPGDVDDPGLLVVAYRFAGIPRSSARREVFEFVLTV